MKTCRTLFVILLATMSTLACTITIEGPTLIGSPVSIAPSPTSQPVQPTPVAPATGQPSPPTPAATGRPVQLTPAPTTAPASPVPPTTVPDTGPAVSAGGMNPTGEALNTLGTFRQRMTVNFKEASTGATSIYHYQADVNTTQQAIHAVVSAEGAGVQYLPSNKAEAIWIGEQLWVKIGNQPWILVPESGAIALFEEQIYPASKFIPYIPGVQKAGPDETINGILCHHYRYSIQNVPIEDGTVSGTGELYTAVQGGYVVRYTLNGTATFTGGGMSGTGALSVVYDTYDVGANIVIQPPRGR